MHLPAILNRYGDEVEADFRQFYHLDLLDMYRGGLSPSLVLRLIVKLPKDSRFVRAVGGASHEWGTEAYLLAQAVDLLAGANYQRAGRGRKPKPVPRPADSKKPLGGKHTRKVSQRDVKNFFATRQAVADA